MKKKISSAAKDSAVFWELSKDYINHQLPVIQNASSNTVNSYRTGLNLFIDYLEHQKKLSRDSITFTDFSRDNIKDFMRWMRTEKNYAEKTCNLRLTAIHSLLEYAANENSVDLMSIYMESKSVDGLTLSDAPIEYFEAHQMEALLNAPDTDRKTGRRNQMMLVLYYDTGARISELLAATPENLHLSEDVPFIEIFGKGRQYRNVPLMDKTIDHLKRYLSEFHRDKHQNTPLFYASTHGIVHNLSPDSVEKMIKDYSKKCEEEGINMPKNPHCHMIRKTRAMDLYKNGMSLAHIQQLLGHKSISTTSGFYAFATLDTLASAMSKANNAGTSSAQKKWKDEEIQKVIYRL